MKVASRPLTEFLAGKRETILREWLARTLQTYPDHASRFLLHNKDPFRNPVGHTLSEGFAVLFDELVAGMDLSRVTQALHGVMKIRAVQDFSASEAVAFVFLLKRIVREQTEGQTVDLVLLEARIDDLGLLAFDLFVKCREKLLEIKAGEARRRVYVQLRRGESDGSPRP